MKEFGEICHFIWNDLREGPAAKSWSQPCLSPPIRVRCRGYPHRWPQWFCAEKKVTISQMLLTVEELQERFRGDGSQVGPCRRLSGEHEHLWGVGCQRPPPQREGSQEVMKLIEEVFWIQNLL